MCVCMYIYIISLYIYVDIYNHYYIMTKTEIWKATQVMLSEKEQVAEPYVEYPLF
jgi:hypothetical protein